MKIKITVGEKEIEIGKLDLSCNDCAHDIKFLMGNGKFEKISIYKSTIHGESEWHLEVD